MTDFVERPTPPGTPLGRREFTLEAALAILAGCIITISDACGSSSSATSPSTTTAVADINAVIGTNHGHAGVIAAAQITAGNAVALNIQGTAAHSHTVSLTQTDMTALKNRQAVSTTSSTDQSATFGLHSHSVTFTPV
jgi:hypothetical protein